MNCGVCVTASVASLTGGSWIAGHRWFGCCPSRFATRRLLSANGETAFLAPTFQDAFGNPTGGAGLTWGSRDPGVAIVASDGLVTGVGAGSTYVTASFAAPSDSILVTVTMRGAITVTFDDGFVIAYTTRGRSSRSSGWWATSA
jgi:hypothetical protein